MVPMPQRPAVLSEEDAGGRERRGKEGERKGGQRGRRESRRRMEGEEGSVQ